MFLSLLLQNFKNRADICLTTDDEEIISYAKFLQVDVIKRSPHLCEDHVPLAPVLYNTLSELEHTKNYQLSTVALFQPTSRFEDPDDA